MTGTEAYRCYCCYYYYYCVCVTHGYCRQRLALTMVMMMWLWTPRSVLVTVCLLCVLLLFGLCVSPEEEPSRFCCFFIRRLEHGEDHRTDGPTPG